MNSRASTDCLDKHTPGPWFGKHGHRTTIVRGVYTNDGYCVVTFGGIAKPASAEGQANAKLIAAAPDLLAACEKAKKFLESDLVEPGRTVFWQLVEAIRKAKGDA